MRPPGAANCGLTSVSNVGPQLVKTLAKPGLILLSSRVSVLGAVIGLVMATVMLVPLARAAIHFSPVSAVTMAMARKFLTVVPSMAVVPATLLYTKTYL